MAISMKRSIVLGAIAGVLSIASLAQAADITGAWSTDLTACNSLFAKRGTTVEFAKGAGIIGSGFIVAGNKITGEMASCNIKARKQDGSTLHLIAACSDDVVLSTNQFSLKLVNDNQIVRLFPGMDDLNTSYYRCPI